MQSVTCEFVRGHVVSNVPGFRGLGEQVGKATAFTSFTGFGTNGQGQEGGVLSIVVTHYCTTMGMTMTNIPVTVTCTVGAPADSTYTEGTTVGDFTQPTGGGVEIEPEQ